jgi:drug/metabolite transporter (DMT)-like permease
MLNLPWTNGNDHHESTGAANKQDPIKGAVMILAGCVCWSAFNILQARTPILIQKENIYINIFITCHYLVSSFYAVVKTTA